MYNLVHNQSGQYSQYSQIEDVLLQYELEINEVTKGRGTYICHTKDGELVLMGFRGTKEKGDYLKTHLEALNDAGFSVEQILKNKEGEAVTIDEITGERFLLKEYRTGTELNVNQLKELKEASALLARYHTIAVELSRNHSENHLEEGAHSDDMQCVVEEKEKHLRELVKVRNYIRNRKKKNEFERIYLNAYEPMVQKAKASIAVLEKETKTVLPSCICHGDYNQHNILLSGNEWRMVNFENFVYRWCIWDLANFLRKMQEKNDWDIHIGRELILSYAKIRPLGEEEIEKLYGLLLFPEKFWKVTNHYMNSRKNWICERDIEKLKKVIAQENKRMACMEALFPHQYSFT